MLFDAFNAAKILFMEKWIQYSKTDNKIKNAFIKQNKLMDLDSLKCHSSLWTIVIMAIIGIVYFMIHWSNYISRKDGKAEWEDLRAAFKEMIPGITSEEHSKELATLSQRNELALSEYAWA